MAETTGINDTVSWACHFQRREAARFERWKGQEVIRLLVRIAGTNSQIFLSKAFHRWLIYKYVNKITGNAIQHLFIARCVSPAYTLHLRDCLLRLSRLANRSTLKSDFCDLGPPSWC